MVLGRSHLCCTQWIGDLQMVQILQQGVCKTSRDVELLNIFDFNRLNGYWQTTSDAIQAMGRLLVDQAIYTVYTADLAAAPERDDWPRWKHTGHHAELGRRYWNWFHHHFPNSVLEFSDGP